MDTAFGGLTTEQYRDFFYEPQRQEKIRLCGGPTLLGYFTHPLTRCGQRDCPRCGNRAVRRQQALTFKANEVIRQAHPRSNVQLVTGTVQDCSYEHVRKAVTALKAGMSKLLRGLNTLGWVSVVEISPSEVGKSRDKFIHPHIHALVWTPQFSPLPEDGWIVTWQGMTDLGADLQIKPPIPTDEIKKAIFYLHKSPPFETLKNNTRELYDEVMPLLVGARLVERGGMAATRFCKAERMSSPVESSSAPISELVN